jgi:hypothetical protein
LNSFATFVSFKAKVCALLCLSLTEFMFEAKLRDGKLFFDFG